MVFAVALAATLAFRGAVPSLNDEGPSLVSPGFAVVSGDNVNRTMKVAGETWRVRYLTALARVAARRAAITHMRELLRGGKSSVGDGNDDAPQAAVALGGFADAVDGLPSKHTSVAATAVEVRGTLPPQSVVVQLRASLRTFRAVGSDRTLDWRGELTMQLGSDGTWKPSGGRLLGTPPFEDPVVEVRPNAMVIGPSERASFVAAAANEATVALPKMRERYDLVAGPERTNMFVIEHPRAVRRLLGKGHTAPTQHPTGWTYETGDVVLVWSQLRSLTLAGRMGVVRHETVHVATLPLMRHAPTMLLEGIATFEETAAVTEGTDLVIDLTSLRAAFRDGSLGYQDLLHSTRPNFGRSAQAGIDMGYLAGYATVGYIDERHGHTKLQRVLAQLRAGVKIDATLTRVLDLTPVELQKGVRVWTADQVRKAAA